MLWNIHCQESRDLHRFHYQLCAGHDGDQPNPTPKVTADTYPNWTGEEDLEHEIASMCIVTYFGMEVLSQRHRRADYRTEIEDGPEHADEYALLAFRRI